MFIFNKNDKIHIKSLFRESVQQRRVGAVKKLDKNRIMTVSQDWDS